jgi:hypothetical protein
MIINNLKVLKIPCIVHKYRISSNGLSNKSHLYLFEFQFPYSYNDLNPLLTQPIFHNAFNFKIWLQHKTNQTLNNLVKTIFFLFCHHVLKHFILLNILLVYKGRHSWSFVLKKLIAPKQHTTMKREKIIMHDNPPCTMFKSFL